MRRFFLSIVILAVVTIGSVVWVANEPRVQQWLGEQASKQLHDAFSIPARVAWVYWNPLAGTISLGDVALYDAERDSWLEVPLIEAAFRWGEVRLPAIVIDRLTLHGLRLSLHVDAQGNIEQLAPLRKAIADLAGGDTGDTFELLIGEVRLVAADIRVTMADPWMEFRARDLNADVRLDGLTPVAAAVDLRGGMYQIMDWRYDGVRIIGTADFASDAIRFEQVAVRIDRPRIDLELDGAVRLDGSEPLVHLSTGGPADVSLVNLHYTDIPTLLGTVQVNADIDISADGDLALRGMVAAEAIEVQQRLVRNVRGAIDLDNNGLRFDYFDADVQPGALALTGTILWEHDVDLALYPRLDGVPVDWLEAFFGPTPANPQGVFSGVVRVGVRDVPDVVVDVTARGGVRLDAVDGRVLPPDWRRDALDVDVALRATTHDLWILPSRFRHPFAAGAVSAVAAIDHDAPFAITVMVTTPDVGRLLNLYDFAVSGAVDAEVTVQPQASTVAFRANDLLAYGTAWDYAEAVIEIDAQSVQAREVFAAANRGTMQGAVTFHTDSGRYEGALRVQDLELVDVFAGADVVGTVGGDVHFIGAEQTAFPVVVGRAAAKKLRWRDLAIGDVSLVTRSQGNLVRGGIRVADGHFDVRFDPQRLAGSISGTMLLGLPDAAHAWSDAQQLKMDVTARVALRHTVVHAFMASPQTGTNDELWASVLYDNGVWTASAWANARLLVGHAGVRVDAAGESVVAGRVHVNDVPAGAAEWLSTLKGSVSAALLAPGLRWQEADGYARLSDVAATRDDFAVLQSGTADIRVSGGRLSLLQPVVLAVERLGDVVVSGDADLGRRWGLHLQGVVPLDLLEALPIGIRDATGVWAVGATLSGPWDEPDLRGQGAVQNGRILLDFADSPIEDISGDLRFVGGALDMPMITGRIGDGLVRLSGSLGLLGVRSGSAALRMDLDVPRLQIDRKLTTTAVGYLELDGSWQGELVLGGDVELSSLRYVDEIAWEPALLKLRNRVVEPEPLNAAFDPRLDVRLHGSRDLRVDTNLLDGAFRLGMTLGGTTRFPRFFGNLEFDRDSLFFFRNQIYSLRRGTVQYADAGGRKPFVDIEAATAAWYEQPDTPRIEYRILLNIIGPIDQLTVEFNSEPPLEEGEILSLLSLGVLPSDLESTNDGSGLQFGGYQVSSLLLSSQISRIEQEIQSIIGFDRLDIEPAFNSARGHSSMQVTVQKRIGDRFNLRLSTGLENNADQRIELGYRVSRSINLSVGWDNADEENASKQLDIGNFFTRPRLILPLP